MDSGGGVAGRRARDSCSGEDVEKCLDKGTYKWHR